MFGGLKSLAETVRGGVELAGGPMGTLLNPQALKEISSNVQEALPPSTVLVGILSRLVSEAIAVEMIKRGPSDRYVKEAVAIGVDPEVAERLFHLMWEEFVNA